MQMELWDKSEEWVLKRFFRHASQVYVVLSVAEPLSVQLAQLRRCFPPLRSLSPQQLRAKIDASGAIDLGEMSEREAVALAGELDRAGIQYRRDDRSSIGYLPMNKTRNGALIIEDPQEAEVIAKQMIEAGIPVEDVED